MGEEKENILEEQFRDTSLELRVVRYICDTPSLCGMIERKWFSIDVLKAVWDILRDKKIPLTKEMILQDLKESGQSFLKYLYT